MCFFVCLFVLFSYRKPLKPVHVLAPMARHFIFYKSKYGCFIFEFLFTISIFRSFASPCTAGTFDLVQKNHSMSSAKRKASNEEEEEKGNKVSVRVYNVATQVTVVVNLQISADLYAGVGKAFPDLLEGSFILTTPSLKLLKALDEESLSAESQPLRLYLKQVGVFLGGQ